MNCPIYKKCGGCQLRNLSYEEQLSLKQSKIIKLIGRYCHVDEIIGMENPNGYRNKTSRIFGFRNGKIVSGIYQSSSRRIAQTDSCLLEDEYADKIIKSLRELCVFFKIKAYDLNTGRGFFRHAMIRKGAASGEIMVALVTAKGDFPHKKEFTEALLKRHTDITTVIWCVNPTETPLYIGEVREILHGNGYITDTLLGKRFRISPRSFYQVNSKQTEILYSKALEFAALTGKEKVIDAYCGTGTIGLALADKAKAVIGVESNPDAVADAQTNARENAIKNASFTVADAGDFMQNLALKGERADVVITDPPRAGCSKRFLDALLALSPKRIVYISCNPETLSRDLFALRKGGYKVKKIQPVDMFPFTEHIECVVCLSREKADDYIRISVHTKDLQAKAN